MLWDVGKLRHMIVGGLVFARVWLSEEKGACILQASNGTP